MEGKLHTDVGTIGRVRYSRGDHLLSRGIFEARSGYWRWVQVEVPSVSVVLHSWWYVLRSEITTDRCRLRWNESATSSGIRRCTVDDVSATHLVTADNGVMVYLWCYVRSLARYRHLLSQSTVSQP